MDHHLITDPTPECIKAFVVTQSLHTLSVSTMQNGRRFGARSSYAPRQCGAQNLCRWILVLQAGGENRSGLFGKLEFVESTLKFRAIIALRLVFKADTNGFAIGRQRLEGIAPTLCFGETLTQLRLVGNRNASLLQGIQKLLKGFVAQATHFYVSVWFAVSDHHEANNAPVLLRLTRN
ncbi:MAG: hypothetical protein LWW81_10815 [Rhodocyclales bacterium]|nr:hypothetical protein [Rhodocyclales bacterium]